MGGRVFECGLYEYNLNLPLNNTAWVPLDFILSGKNSLRLKIKRAAGGVDGPKFSTRDSKGDSSIQDSANMVYVVVRFVSVCSRMANTKAAEGESYILTKDLEMHIY